jgi:hemoglobin
MKEHQLDIAVHTAAAADGPAIDEPTIALVVETFYRRVRADERLGPLFEARITDWDRHLGIMRDFWSAGLLRTGRYSGRPLDRHRQIDGLTAADFTRWLTLFRATVHECCTPAGSAAFNDLAERMAVAMTKMLGLTARDDGQLRPAPSTTPTSSPAT